MSILKVFPSSLSTKPSLVGWQSTHLLVTATKSPNCSVTVKSKIIIIESVTIQTRWVRNNKDQQMMVSRRTSLMPNFSVWMQSSDLITFNNCLCVNKQSTATMLSIINVTPSTVEKIGVMQQSVTFSGKSDEKECRTFFMLFALPFFSSPVPWLEYDKEVLSWISYLSREESKQSMISLADQAKQISNEGIYVQHCWKWFPWKTQLINAEHSLSDILEMWKYVPNNTTATCYCWWPDLATIQNMHSMPTFSDIN